MQRLWLISYDIANQRRRRAVDHYLAGLGQRVLESLYECWLRADQVRTLPTELAAFLDPQHDRLALLPVCGHCQHRVCDHGPAPAPLGDPLAPPAAHRQLSQPVGRYHPTCTIV